MLYFEEEHLGISHRELVTHSFRSRFAIKIFLATVYPKMITIIAIWSINYFLHYIRIQVSYLNKGVSDLMNSDKALYTITESDIIYYKTRQSITHTYRQHPQRGNTKVTTSSLLLQL